MTRPNLPAAAAAILLLVAAAACRDGPTEPVAGELTLEIRRDGVPFEEETIAPGTTLQLTAKLLTATGGEQSLSGADWESVVSSVASVDGQGRVTGVATGSTRIIVRAGERADTGVVNVALPVTGELACGPDDPRVSMSVGGVRTFVGPEAVHLCLTAPTSGGASYLVVPFNASVAAGAGLDIRVVASASLLPQAQLSPARVGIPVVPLRAGPLADEEFHLRHLERSREEFETALRLTSGEAQVTPRAIPTVGTLMRLNAGALAGSGCEDPDYRTGRVVAISRRAIIVADTLNPRNGFSSADFETIGRTFDELIWGVNTASFGEPTDIDENERVIIFYTRAVNELTPAGSDSYVGGFAYNRDLFPRSGRNACAGSNEAEMFYMLVPDPEGEIEGNARSKDFVLERTFSVLAHEFQHIINDSRRLYVNDALVWEESWLNEGLSHIAEELAFYAAAGIEPRQNLGTSVLVGSMGNAFDRYNIDNLERYIRFLRAADEHSPMGEVQQLATRGSVWAFLRYVADREPGDDGAMWMRLANSRTLGLENLAEVLGVNPRDWLQDWQVSVFTDDAGLGVREEYTQPSWNYRTLTSVLSATGGFPLRTHTITSTFPPLLLDGGGAAFLRTGVSAGAERALRTTVNELPPPSRLRLAVVRTR